MDAANAEALAALRVSEPLGSRIGRRSMSVCPHCHEGFGSASLPIHVRRCRALQEQAAAAEEAAKQPVKPPKKPKPIASLMDM